jgi:DNA-directed RNA polymerase subunit RPC12/RpoP
VSRERARALLDGCQSRGDIKRAAALVEHDETLRAALMVEARARGVELPDEAAAWPAKRLVRRARGREAASRVRSNPVHRDESFTCVACGASVPAHGRTARDHCPHCLASLHVDVVPGDRAASCGGVLRATHVEQRNGEWVLHYRCDRCGAARTNRALLDGETPDRWDVIVALSGRAAAP